MARTKIDGEGQIVEESITGGQVKDESVTGSDITDGSITRQDLNITSTGRSTITRILAGAGVSLVSSGADSGTGEVQISISTSSGLNYVSHRALDQLVHSLAETSFYEVIRSSGKIMNEIWWETSAKLKKIRSIDYTYSGNNVLTSTTKQYDSSGSAIVGETFTETYDRIGTNIISVDGVLS